MEFIFNFHTSAVSLPCGEFELRANSPWGAFEIMPACLLVVLGYPGSAGAASLYEGNSLSCLLEGNSLSYLPMRSCTFYGDRRMMDER